MLAVRECKPRFAGLFTSDRTLVYRNILIEEIKLIKAVKSALEFIFKYRNEFSEQLHS